MFVFLLLLWGASGLVASWLDDANWGWDDAKLMLGVGLVFAASVGALTARIAKTLCVDPSRRTLRHGSVHPFEDLGVVRRTRHTTEGSEAGLDGIPTSPTTHERVTVRARGDVELSFGGGSAGDVDALAAEVNAILFEAAERDAVREWLQMRAEDMKGLTPYRRGA